MEKLNILAVGRNDDIMEVVCRLINSHTEWTGAAVTEDAEALRLLDQQHFNILLLCAGISAAEERSLVMNALQLQPQLRVIQHYGGGSGLLENEILHQYER
jgi:hypothetical protein